MHFLLWMGREGLLCQSCGTLTVPTCFCRNSLSRNYCNSATVNWKLSIPLRYTQYTNGAWCLFSEDVECTSRYNCQHTHCDYNSGSECKGGTYESQMMWTESPNVNLLYKSKTVSQIKAWICVALGTLEPVVSLWQYDNILNFTSVYLELESLLVLLVGTFKSKLQFHDIWYILEMCVCTVLYGR